MAKILVVDDDMPSRVLAERILSALGYQVAQARDGLEAIEKVWMERPGLVLLDVMMPGRDGIETLRQLRRIPELRDTPVIMVTAIADRAKVQEILQLGVTDYLVKPFPPDMLAKRVAAVVKSIEEQSKRQRQASAHSIPELAGFLESFRQYFSRPESLHILESYISGLLTNVEGKSGAGIAASMIGLSDSAIHRLMTKTRWDPKALNRHRIQLMRLQASTGDGVLVVHDMGYPRKNQQAVGVANQYCSSLGRVANCQVVVTTSYVDPYHAWPIDGQLFLPQVWCEDATRRQQAGIPDGVAFETRTAIALHLIDEARAAGVSFEVVVSSRDYGDDPAFLVGLEARNLSGVMGVSGDLGVRFRKGVKAATSRPLITRKKVGQTQEPFYPVPPPPVCRADEALAAQPEEHWQTIRWRLGSDVVLTKQWIALRGYRDVAQTDEREGWLIGMRPLPGQEGEQKFYWSNLPASISLGRLAELAHRWPMTERTGLDTYTARTWDSFHRHLAIDFLMLSWLVLQGPPVEGPVIEVEPLV